MQTATILRGVSQRPAAAVDLGVPRLLASLLSGAAAAGTLGASPATCEALGVALDAAYLLLGHGVSLCRAAVRRRQGHACAASDAEAEAEGSASWTGVCALAPAASVAADDSEAAAAVARLRPLASRPELLLRLAATSLAPALLREKAARCVLHLVRLLALSDPRTAVAGLLSPHRASAPDDRALAAARPAAALLAAALAASQPCEARRCLRRATDLLEACDGVAFRAAVAACPALEAALSAEE